MIWRFANLWDGTQWLSSAVIETDKDGFIKSLHNSPHSPPHSPPHNQNYTIDEDVSGWAVPGLQNAHSHAFQFAMAGLTEYIDDSQHPDDFWSWRQKMYQFVLTLTPRQMESIATNLYATMLKNGYTWVAEFHYLHHDRDGKPYENLSEMGQALLSAADKTGIGITLIPIFYDRGGFRREPHDEQRRFLSKNTHDYLQLHSLTSTYCRGPRQKCALGIHSLRAADPENIKILTGEAPPSYPWHIHIAEQKKEVLESLEVLGQRPVQWLINNVDINDSWHLIHATHINTQEIKALQQQQAHVVLCPSTEGNLGDGIFPLKEYWHGGGHWSIGSDSHVTLSPLEELRWLDYVQRLSETQRNVLCCHNERNSGKLLFKEALASGRKAMGFQRESSLQSGELLDLVVIKPKTILWDNTPTPNLLSTFIYSTSSRDFSGVITSGKWVVKEGQHIFDSEFSQDWAKNVSSLRNL